MTNRIPDNSSFTIADPNDVLLNRRWQTYCQMDGFEDAGAWALDLNQDDAYKASLDPESIPEAMGWREWDALDDKEAADRARARAHVQSAIRTRHYRTQSRVRARRSPASTRRATTDSGGDSDGGGDPEPPHRPPSNTPRVGGAL